MDTLKELLDLIRLGVTERITSPLLGNFVISWSLWNYRFFIVILGENQTTEKFRLIDTVLYPDARAYWFAFLIPLTASLLIIYAYPVVARYVYEHKLEVNKDLMERRHRVEDTEPMDVEQARQLRIGMREKERQWLARVSEVEQENEDLRRSLDSPSDKQGRPETEEQDEHSRKLTGTTKTVAARLGANSGKELVIAAAAQLTFVEGKDTFSRQELIDSMKTATGYFKPTYVGNLTKYIDQIIAEQIFIETASNEFAIKGAYRKDLESRLH